MAKLTFEKILMTGDVLRALAREHLPAPAALAVRGAFRSIQGKMKDFADTAQKLQEDFTDDDLTTEFQDALQTETEVALEPFPVSLLGNLPVRAVDLDLLLEVGILTE